MTPSEDVDEKGGYGTIQNRVLVGKCRVLIEDTKRRLHEIDRRSLPAQSSREALGILDRTVEAIAEPENLRQVRPKRLYSALLSLQDLIRDIESSSSYHLSWPLIEFLGSTFGEMIQRGQFAAFYSTMREHNYHTFSYNERFRESFRGAIPKGTIKSILGRRELLCVELPSVEEDHPVLHANVFHEFGHVLLAADESFAKSYASAWLANFGRLIPGIVAAIHESGVAKDDRQETLQTIMNACWGFASEGVCDSVGSSVFGPAFELACMEMNWGLSPQLWTVKPSGEGGGMHSHPSFAFRSRVMRRLRAYVDFRDKARPLFGRLHTPILRKFDLLMGTANTPPGTETIAVNRYLPGDPQVSERVLNLMLRRVAGACEKTVLRFEGVVRRRVGTILEPASAKDVYRLLVRLENDLPPNTYADTIPCGQGASFQSILAAGLYYRTAVLSEDSGDASRKVHDRISRADRLLSKAIELSYVQRYAPPIVAG